MCDCASCRLRAKGSAAGVPSHVLLPTYSYLSACYFYTCSLVLFPSPCWVNGAHTCFSSGWQLEIGSLLPFKVLMRPKRWIPLPWQSFSAENLFQEKRKPLATHKSAAPILEQRKPSRSDPQPREYQAYIVAQTEQEECSCCCRA